MDDRERSQKCSKHTTHFLGSLNTPLIKLVYYQNVIKSQPHAEKKFGAILIFIHGLCHMYKLNLLFLKFRWKMFTFIV